MTNGCGAGSVGGGIDGDDPAKRFDRAERYVAAQGNVVDSDLFEAVVAIALVTDLCWTKQGANGCGTHDPVGWQIESGRIVDKASRATTRTSASASRG